MDFLETYYLNPYISCKLLIFNVLSDDELEHLQMFGKNQRDWIYELNTYYISNNIIFSRFLNKSISGVIIDVNATKSHWKLKKFKVFLSSQEEFNDFHKNDFNIDGVELISSRSEPGYQQYNVKILKNNFLGRLFRIYFHILF